MNFRTYRTTIVKDTNGYRGFVPALPGCHSYGKTIEETQKNLKEAAEGWLLARDAMDWPIPDDTNIESLMTVEIPNDHPVAYA